MYLVILKVFKTVEDPSLYRSLEIFDRKNLIGETENGKYIAE